MNGQRIEGFWSEPQEFLFLRVGVVVRWLPRLGGSFYVVPGFNYAAKEPEPSSSIGEPPVKMLRGASA